MSDTKIKRYWVGTSWKMNMRLVEAMEYSDTLCDLLADIHLTSITPFVLPPFTVLRDVAYTFAGGPIIVGAQNMHWEAAGAWTGEISGPMLKDCGARIVEIGHSERREHFGETDETVGLKVAAAIKFGLMPLICLGETLAEREAHSTADVLAKQVSHALSHLKADHASNVLFAYEPVWSIGERGQPATPAYANDQQLFIKSAVRAELGFTPPVLYGGSVNLNNCEELLKCPSIDGLFIGRAAWKPEGFAKILARCSAVASAQKSTEGATP